MKQKKVIFFLFALSLLTIHTVSQTKQTGYEDPQNMAVETQREAYYPDGEQQLATYVYKNIKFSANAKAKKIHGDVVLSFNVQTDSTLTDINVITPLGYGIDEEVVRLFKPLKFVPAIQGNIPVVRNVIMSIPVIAYPD